MLGGVELGECALAAELLGMVELGGAALDGVAFEGSLVEEEVEEGMLE